MARGKECPFTVKGHLTPCLAGALALPFSLVMEGWLHLPLTVRMSFPGRTPSFDRDSVVLPAGWLCMQAQLLPPLSPLPSLSAWHSPRESTLESCCPPGAVTGRCRWAAPCPGPGLRLIMAGFPRKRPAPQQAWGAGRGAGAAAESPLPFQTQLAVAETAREAVRTWGLLFSFRAPGAVSCVTPAP